MNTQFVSTISEEPSWLMSNLWWLALVGIVVLTIIWGGSKAILAGMIFGIIQLLPLGLDQSTPEATALGITKAVNQGDTTTAKCYVTPNSKDVVVSMIRSNRPNNANEVLKNLRSAECQISPDGNRAFCKTCCMNAKGATDKTGGYVKIDGKWYIDLVSPR